MNTTTKRMMRFIPLGIMAIAFIKYVTWDTFYRTCFTDWIFYTGLTLGVTEAVFMYCFSQKWNSIIESARKERDTKLVALIELSCIASLFKVYISLGKIYYY